MRSTRRMPSSLYLRSNRYSRVACTFLNVLCAPDNKRKGDHLDRHRIWKRCALWHIEKNKSRFSFFAFLVAAACDTIVYDRRCEITSGHPINLERACLIDSGIDRVSTVFLAVTAIASRVREDSSLSPSNTLAWHLSGAVDRARVSSNSSQNRYELVLNRLTGYRHTVLIYIDVDFASHAEFFQVDAGLD